MKCNEICGHEMHLYYELPYKFMGVVNDGRLFWRCPWCGFSKVAVECNVEIKITEDDNEQEKTT